MLPVSRFRHTSSILSDNVPIVVEHISSIIQGIAASDGFIYGAFVLVKGIISVVDHGISSCERSQESCRSSCRLLDHKYSHIYPHTIYDISLASIA